MTPTINRREFLSRSAAGMTFGLAIAGHPFGGASADAPLAPNVWVNIGTDGVITIMSPAAELGQGSFTSLPVILAEELDADWSKVRAVQPPAWDTKLYGNPGYGQRLSTTSSFSVNGYFKA